MMLERLLIGSVRPAEVSYGMNSAIIGKIEKAINYAQEPERVTFYEFVGSFKGDHKQHRISYDITRWHCTCSFFNNRGICSHVMTLERTLPTTLTPAEAILAPA
ncbi:MAG: SWIM zinc finger family protein [Anaerolineae bacterium]|nr:SWIM zinc finger family protein [Anaerolineae bacterium]